ncbi:hypothetical protein FRC00_012124 [Tulasnella sp. 408]|nr:hypothetical protein FRC00_012124 [Tulasnella sp. 408]
MPITQRTEALVTPTVALFSQGKSQLHGLELAYAYIAAAALVDSPFPLEWTILLLVLVRKLILLLRYNEGETKTPFVILILVHYEGWTDNQDGGRSMQLNAVKEDMKLLLDTLRCERLFLSAPPNPAATCSIGRPAWRHHPNVTGGIATTRSPERRTSSAVTVEESTGM